MPRTVHTPLAERFVADLRSWHPRMPQQERLKQEYLALADQGDEPFRRRPRREHLTASCFVFDEALTQVLLCFHRKGQFWVQLGGHIEDGDGSVPAAAFREAAEESGLQTLRPLRRRPVDLNVHALGSGFSHCTAHWDVGYAAVAPRGAQLVVSEESEELRWWPVKALPAGVAAELDTRLRGVLTELGAA
ncbi:NUDIX domain-containing protein [Nesterenkonia xinjiangensis]|uniref:8-oxo-dGTP pyrophosphatase MutT (NUDIX family) n=1 Tax=Nesterenkonia xinjiangensis TaxID=225327 RepID=A0A7Z0GMV5_9MICC|nr:NUDIX domain-containing protein [Nesterenkonia xinjiangensis]NYJ78608.1 8-oxo-dGTP pyrophosphatase MutT (NUDIX family) [Nesterenkonia xinjiangensis]